METMCQMKTIPRKRRKGLTSMTSRRRVATLHPPLEMVGTRVWERRRRRRLLRPLLRVAHALAFDPVLTRRAVSHRFHHDIAQAKVMYTGQRVCQAVRRTSPVLPTAAWAIWPPRPPQYMDGGYAHTLLVMATLTNTLVRLRCGDRTRAIAIRATTLEGRPSYRELNLPRVFGPFRYRVILGLLLCPCS